MSHQLPTAHHAQLQSQHHHFFQLNPTLLAHCYPSLPFAPLTVPLQQFSSPPPAPSSSASSSASSNAVSSTTAIDADSSTSSSSGAATPITPQQQQQIIPQMGTTTVSTVHPCHLSLQMAPPFVGDTKKSAAMAQIGGTSAVGAATAHRLTECATNVAAAEIKNNNKVSIELANRDLWQKFHRITNEMVVTRTGRKMFPKLELQLRGLDPNGMYSLSLCMRQLDNARYKYQTGGWSQAAQEDSSASHSNVVHHHDGVWNRGDFWTSQDKLCFDRVKLTNREVQSNSLLSLCSMHKYQPVINLFGLNTDQQMVRLCSFEPPETQFIAVTAYQSEAITQLKVKYNPFAKGFREGSARKRTLSPSPVPNCAGERNAANDSLSDCPSAKRPSLYPSSLFAACPSAIQPSFPLHLPLYGSVPSWNYPLSAILASMASCSSMSNGGSFAGGYQPQNSQIQMAEIGKMYSQIWKQQQQQQQQSSGSDEAGPKAKQQ